MTKRLFSIIFFCAMLALGARAHFTYAQKEQPAPLQTQQLQRIEARLDELAAISRAQKELDKKLERILTNQEKIITELGIIRVRASQR